MKAAPAPWLCGAFLLSGISALVYQLAWHRVLLLFAGGDVVAATLIVTAFMAGLGLGSLIGGGIADRFPPRTGLFAFVLAEAGIAVFGLASAWLFHEVLYERLVMRVESRAIIALWLFACLLPPTLLMGLSLPVLARVVTTLRADAARWIGLLYAANTIGAALGAFLATWVLLPLGGVEGALRWASFGNGMCAVFGAFALPWIGPEPAAKNAPSLGKPAPTLSACLVIFFAAGFASLAAEMVWLRLFGAMAKASAQTTGTLLAIYLAGLGTGAAAGSLLGRLRIQPLRGFLGIEGAAILYASGGAALALAAIGHTPLRGYLAAYEPIDADVAARLLHGWWRGALDAEDARHVWTYPLFHLVLPFVLMFPATFLMGAGFPLMQRAVQTCGGGFAWRTGALQCGNILGCMAGSAAVTGLLLPHWGSAGVFKLLAVLGAALLLGGTSRRWRVASGIAGAAVLMLLPDQSGLWAAVHGTKPDRLWLAEDASGVSIMKRDDEVPGRLTVFTNGIGQSWIPYGGVHTLLGVLPVLLHDRPERVALIGLGSGDTLHAMMARRETREAWCAEIVTGQRRTLDAVRREPGAGQLEIVLDDSRIRHFGGDGRIMILRDPGKFDIIEADALRPTSAHAGMLYSREYFELVRSRLRPRGMAVTWVPTQRVLETMRTVFPEVLVFGGIIAIGSMERIDPDWNLVASRLNEAGTGRHFEEAGVEIVPLVQSFLGAAGAVARLDPTLPSPGRGAINTDLFPRDEWILPSLHSPTTP